MTTFGGTMYAVDIICSNGHTFEAWFANRAAFERQRDENLIICTACGDTAVQQRITAPRIRKHSDSNAPDVSDSAKAPGTNANIAKANATAQVPKLIDFIEKHFEDVGAKFADEAVKMHYGESEHRNIRGTATADEEKQLSEEGVKYLKLPNVQ